MSDCLEEIFDTFRNVFQVSNMLVSLIDECIVSTNAAVT